MRLRVIKDAANKLKEFKNFIEFKPQDNKSKWNEVFRNDNERCLEIGMGKGKFIREHAKKYRYINYLGLEISPSIVLKAARKISEDKLYNLKLINTDAANLNEIFAKGELSRIYLNFSDPWPKARHEKRRLTSDTFINIYKEILNETGVIEMKTDNRGLFEYSVVQFNKHGFMFNKLSLDLHQSLDETREIITTEYEEKFKSLGKVIYYIEVEK